MSVTPHPAARFTVLASGSAGNANLLEVDGFGLMIDCGLRPQILTERLAAVGRTWDAVHAVLITHTHGDHWNRHTLAHLRRNQMPLIAHATHHDSMTRCAEHEPLRRAGLTRTFDVDQTFPLAPGLTARGTIVPHDSDPTFAFRFDYRTADGTGWSLGLVSDMGHPTDELLSAFRGVNVLAVEFNHEVALQEASRRPRMLVNRVLGMYGHLSNAQAGKLATAVAASAGPSRFDALVQLHLSRECNRPELAHAAGRAALAAHAPNAMVVTASQNQASPPVNLVSRTVPSLPPVAPVRRTVQQCLPGL